MARYTASISFEIEAETREEAMQIGHGFADALDNSDTYCCYSPEITCLGFDYNPDPAPAPSEED